MTEKLKQIHKDFNPKIYNTAYLTRTKLLGGVSKFSSLMKGKMLDFGCGSKPYRLLFNVDEYVGLDYEGHGHDHSNEQIDVFYEGKSFPFSDEYFDCVLSTEVFEHVFNLNSCISELNRVLKTGGTLLITCPFAIGEHESPNDYGRYTSFAMKHMLEEAGFEIIYYEKLGNSHEAIAQLRLGYFANNIASFLKKIHFLYLGVSFLVNTWVNCRAILLSKILPSGQELYLNNLVVCKKL